MLSGMSAALSTVKNENERLRSRLSGLAKRAREESETIMDTALSVGAAAALGAADTAWGTDAIMGASPSLVVGVAATGAALLGLGGSMDGALLAVGRTGLAVEAYRWGSRTYTEWSTREGG